MKILIINSGSSSIKYQLIQMPDEIVICTGLVERIGLEDSMIHHQTSNNRIEGKIEAKDHKQGLEGIAKILLDPKNAVIRSTDEIAVVGHRVVHGGSSFSQTVFIDSEVKEKIQSLFSLAPLHNPPNFEGIVVAEETFPAAKQVAVFDTAFHQTIPEVAHRYAIPKKLSDERKIRLYGFHGTSHKYVSQKAIEFLGKSESKVISIHLGNGCSMSAIKNGKSIDHSLGFGPMNGLIMGTRSGDIDQSVIFYLMDRLKLSSKEVSDILQRQSGMYGLTGYSDLREIEEQAEKGNKDCELALAMSAYRIKKYIGSYVAAMNGLDAIVFTAGIGENSSTMRSLVCQDMEVFGIVLDEKRNGIRSPEIREIGHVTSKIKVLVIPTNEELEIARQSFQLLMND
ncbi:acetate/propionate family kinase [Sungkyunkwania multivorans]|uniref:Acetate kinase n=1 Tax=Sungkyunkwania multivorans TaxID=1173618 RepID=A0ABW3CV14_9FLAO